MTATRFKPLRITTKKQREMDSKPWEEQFKRAWKKHEERLDELLEKVRRYDALTREQGRKLKSRKATEEIKYEASLGIIEYGTFRDIYLELAKTASLQEGIDLRLLEAQSDIDRHTVLIETVGNLAAFTMYSLQTDLPEAFQTWGKRMLQLREELSDEFRKKQSIELKVSKNVHRELSAWVKERERVREAERLLEQKPPPPIYA